MTWRDSRIASDGTHHVLGSEPLYAERFDDVLKFHDPGLAPVRRRGEAWHIRPDGSEAYRRRFGRTFGFYEGLAAVAGPDGWHHIRPDGEDLYASRYAWCGNYKGGRCTVRDHAGAYFHLSAEGAPAYDLRWRYAGDFRDGVAVVQADDGRSTHIGPDGELVHGDWFLDLDVFHKGFARARDHGGWTHVDTGGRPTYSRRFAAVEPFYNGQARVERFDGGLEVIDEAGETVLVLRNAFAARPQAPSVTRILLIGLAGAGKTTVGALLAARLGLSVHRLDDLRGAIADGTVAGDYLARSAFLRACGLPGPAIYEFSAAGYHRVAVRQAFRETGDRLLTAWIDAPLSVRRERLARRESSVPLPNWGIAPGAFDDAMTAKLRADFEGGWWEDGPGWQALRLDGTGRPEQLADTLAAAWRAAEGER